MSDLMDLYQEVILDHNKRPRNFGELTDAERHASGYNPLCGDRIEVYVSTDGGQVEEIRFQGSGCAISTASASIMTESVKGKSPEAVRALFERFRGLVTGAGADDGPELGKLEAFSGVGDYPTRVKCATLAWHTLVAALDGDDTPVTTE